MIMNKKLIVLVGLALAVIGLNGCSESSNASSHGVYAYIPNDNRNCGWERVKIKNYYFGQKRIEIETTDGRTIEGYNITIVKE